MNNLRRRLLESTEIELPKLPVLFAKSDGSQLSVYDYSQWPSSGWTPIAIQVVPPAHNRYGDGTGGYVALEYIGQQGWYSGSSTQDSNFPSSIEYTYIDAGTTDCSEACIPYLDDSAEYAYYSSSLPKIQFPYTSAGGSTKKTFDSGLLSDFQGKEHCAQILQISTASRYLAINKCANYSRTGTQAGDWYTPTAAELTYIAPVYASLNYTYRLLKEKYGALNTTGSECVGNYSSTYYYDIETCIRRSGNLNWVVCGSGHIVYNSGAANTSWTIPFIRY